MKQIAKILVVEDEADLRDLMLLHLRREGHEGVGVESSEAALSELSESKFDLVILDWMLPGLPGIELCRRLRGSYPMLMTTARVDAADIVLGLDAGADDYLTKPFQIAVFIARVRALLRRAAMPPDTHALTHFEVSGLSVDVGKREVRYQDQNLQLTPSEFKALAALVRHRGVILSRGKLIRVIQGEGITVTERAVDTLVFGLRKNLGPAAKLVETVRGVGYRIRMDGA